MLKPTSVLKASIRSANFVPGNSGETAIRPPVPYKGQRLFCRVSEGTGGELAFEVTSDGPDDLGPITGDFATVTVTVNLDTGAGIATIDKPIQCDNMTFAFEPRFDATFSAVTLFIKEAHRLDLSASEAVTPITIGELTFVAISDKTVPGAPYRIVFVDNVAPHQILVEDLPHHGKATLILPEEDGGSEVGPMGLRIDDGP